MSGAGTQRIVDKVPLMTVDADPTDEDWPLRLREELKALIQYQSMNKESDQDWFTIEPNATGTRWVGKCWTFHEMERYEYDFEFDLPATYPKTAPEIALPVLDGLTSKMYRGGKICIDIHFSPLWARHTPTFGVAHALALGLGPWLATEIPDMARRGVIKPTTASSSGVGSSSSSS